MTDSDTGNLIDLSLSFEEACKKPSVSASTLSKCLISSPEVERRESLDNNPFDCIQKLAQRPADLFDLMEKEACYKGHQESHLPVEVKTGNLLSLSDDNILDDNVDDSPAGFEKELPKFASDATLDSVGSTIHQTSNDLETESPPLTVSSRWTPDSGGPDSGGGGGGSSDSSTGMSAKTKKAHEYRKRLLKLSISNSTFNSPVSRRMPIRPDGTPELYDSDYIFQQSPCYGEPMIAAESPLKMIDDDLMSEQPPAFVDADKDFDADLEMLKIPMLQELPLNDETPSPAGMKRLAPPPPPEDNKDVSISSRSQNTSTIGALPNLDALRAKLRSRREESHQTNNSQDIPVLIKNLKSLICDIDAVDEQKKRQASSLLESLSSALGAAKEESLQVPQPITRQGTFDIDLQGQEEKAKETEECPGKGNEAIGGAQMTQSYTKVVHHLEPGNIEDVPDAMFKSSATYDGEPIEERDLFLPRIDSISPETSQHLNGQQQCGVVGADVNDIIEQLSKLLEQHQLNQQQQMHSDSSDGSTAGQTPACNMNPTFIVVMNSSQMPTQNQVASLQSAMERSFHNESLAMDMDGGGNAAMRRRSQSLSIHDKVKIVQLPMSAPMGEDARATTPPTVQMDCNDFKTPSRPMSRRNSFSSGTPYTPMMDGGASAAAAAAAARRAFVMNSANTRRTSLLEQREHRQQQAIVKPTPLPHNTMNTFKPDLKKKLKSGLCGESIMKSSRPLKATIPIKKVAPMLKHSPPTPEELASGGPCSSTRASSLNSSMHLLTKSSKMSYTSTPMPLSRSAGSALGVPTGYPNACSTPTVNASPVRSITRPRYSYGGNMSASKLYSSATPTAATSNMKRRTLTELKAKSPMKSRLSGIGAAGGSAASAFSKATAAAAKVSASRMANNTSRSGTQQQSHSTLTTRAGTTSRLSTRSSFSSSGVGVNKNKENRQP